MCPSTFHVFIFTFYFFFNAFPPKITLGPMTWGRGGGGGGDGGIHVWAWPQGQKVTYSWPKSDVQLAKM